MLLPEFTLRNSAPLLLIGATDCSGGAGLSRDLSVVHRCGGEARLLVTAVTAQSDRAVLGLFPTPESLLAQQFQGIKETPPAPSAIKVGLLACLDGLTVVADVRRQFHHLPCILDPVCAASSGAALVSEALLRAMQSELLPQVTLLTPNVMELGVLAPGYTDEFDQVRSLFDRGVRAILVKGGHRSQRSLCEDRLYLLPEDGDVEVVLTGQSPRQPFDLRGTGCMLATAIACALAGGLDLLQSCRFGHSFVQQRFQERAEPQS